MELEQLLGQCYNAEAYRELSLVNYKIECTEQRLTGQPADCVETLYLNDLRR